MYKSAVNVKEHSIHERQSENSMLMSKAFLSPTPAMQPENWLSTFKQELQQKKMVAFMLLEWLARQWEGLSQTMKWYWDLKKKKWSLVKYISLPLS